MFVPKSWKKSVHRGRYWTTSRRSKDGGMISINPRSPSNGVQGLPYRNQTCWLPRASCRSLVQPIVPMAGERWSTWRRIAFCHDPSKFSLRQFRQFRSLEFCRDREIFREKDGSGEEVEVFYLIRGGGEFVLIWRKFRLGTSRVILKDFWLNIAREFL